MHIGICERNWKIFYCCEGCGAEGTSWSLLVLPVLPPGGEAPHRVRGGARLPRPAQGRPHLTARHDPPYWLVQRQTFLISKF